MTGPHTIATNTVELCSETFGDPDDPTVLLVMGAGSSMLRWDDRFCRRLAAGGRHVVRYDHRDVGRSTTYEPGQASYTLEHLADDAVAVLDHLAIERAHLVGASMGGMIVQLVALRHPTRVRTITAIMSTPDPSATMAFLTGARNGALPPPTAAVLDRLVVRQSLDWGDDEAVIDDVVEMLRTLAGTRSPFDAGRERALATIELIRSPCIASSGNHAIAIAMTPPWRHRLGEIDCPALVIHGAVDPILPLAHGVALAADIPGARLLTLDGVGHELPMVTWDGVLAALLDHTATTLSRDAMSQAGQIGRADRAPRSSRRVRAATLPAPNQLSCHRLGRRRHGQLERSGCAGRPRWREQLDEALEPLVLERRWRPGATVWPGTPSTRRAPTTTWHRSPGDTEQSASAPLACPRQVLAARSRRRSGPATVAAARTRGHPSSGSGGSGATGDAGRLSNVLHRRLGEAALDEQPDSGIGDGGPRRVAPSVGESWHVVPVWHVVPFGTTMIAMSTAQQLFIGYAVIILLVGFALGAILGVLRMKAPAVRNLATAHVETLIQAALHLGLAFAIGIVGFQSTAATWGAVLLVVGSALQAIGATLNWVTNTGDQFAERVTWLQAELTGDVRDRARRDHRRGRRADAALTRGPAGTQNSALEQADRQAGATEVGGLVDRHDRALPGRCRRHPVDARVVRVEEVLLTDEPEHVSEVRVDHAPVTHHGDAFASVAGHHRLDRADDALGELLGALIVRGPLAAQQRLPSRVVGGLELLDRDVLVAVPVPLGDRVHEHGVQAEARRDRCGGLARPFERAGVQGVEGRLGREVVGQVPGLGVAVRRQLGVCCTDHELAANRQRMPDQQQFHGRLATTSVRLHEALCRSADVVDHVQPSDAEQGAMFRRLAVRVYLSRWDS